MLRSLQKNLPHENDYKSMKPTYQTQHELTNILDNAITDSINTNNKNQTNDIEKMRIDNRYQDIGSEHYEDILATATLNKVLEICESVHQEERERERVDICGGSLEHGGTDTDSGLSGSIVGEAHKRVGKNFSEGVSEGSSSPLCESPKEGFSLPENSKNRSSPSMVARSPDIGVVLDTTTDNSADFPWNYGDDPDSYTPLQFKIEEHIEEITTHHLTDDETSNSSYVNDSDSDPCLPNVKEKRKTSLVNAQQGSYGSSIFRKKQYSSLLSSDESSEALQHFDLPSISGDDIIDAKRVPFPELGVDLLQETNGTRTDIGPKEVLLDNTNWKENWLFMKEKEKVVRDVQTSETITMLIPNPCSNINPTIGDRDIDELSELSDRHSNYSFDTSSDDEYGYQNSPSSKLSTVASKDLVDLVGEINAEFGQQDQEYTEDIAKLEKLQFNNTINRNIDYRNGIDINFNKNTNERERILSKEEEGAEEITGVTPVIKSRKFKSLEKSSTSFNSDTYSRNSKIVKKIQKSKAGKSINIVLTPPEGVPQAVGETFQTSSPSVWFESTPEDQSVPAGRVLRLNCQVHSRDICGVSWYFKNELLKEGKNILMWKKGDIYHLNVFEMDEKKTGPYFVAAYTKDHCVWGKCFVSCIEQGRVNKIPRITLTMPEVIVENGSDIVLECQVGGHPEPKVSFIKNSTPLNNQYPNCFVENDQYGSWTLHLKESSEASSGQIKVIASNALGHAMSFFNVNVIPEGQNAKMCAEKFTNSKPTSKVKKPNLESTTKTKTTKPTASSKRTNENYSYNNIINNLNNSSSKAERKSGNSSPYNDNASNLCEAIANNINNEITVNGCMFQPPKPGTTSDNCASFSLSLNDKAMQNNNKDKLKSCSSSDDLHGCQINRCWVTSVDLDNSWDFTNHMFNCSKLPCCSCDELILRADKQIENNNLLTNNKLSKSETKFDIFSNKNFCKADCKADFDRLSLTKAELHGYQASHFCQSFKNNTPQLTSLPPMPGTIAEREHRKWLEAKPMPNNPYSPEKLASRIGRSPSRFPSLPTVCRENSGDEYVDPSLRESILSSASDLTRYSRDYHINDNGMKKKSPYYNYREVDENFEQIRKANQSSTTPKCLVKLEARVAENWKEELKDIKLDVGKKVADIQKTIDAYQHEWEKQMRQRSSNSSDNRYYSLQRGSPKLSASCFNLTSPVKSKSSLPYSSSNSNSRSRHLVYSSTETLNRDQSKNNLWRTVSVDTLNPPFKYSFPSLPSNNKNYEKGHLSHKETELNSSKETLPPKRYSTNLLSDSDDSSNLNTPLYVKNHPYSGQCRGETSTTPFAHQNGYSTKRMTSYCSENSIESLKEESDTEESLLSCADDSNMPSVKELAYKFDSLKNTKNKSAEVRKHHENLRPSRNRTVPSSPSYNNNINFNNDNNNSSRKYNDRVIVNEVHHSLTARSVSKSFREGLRNYTQMKSSRLEPVPDDVTRYTMTSSRLEPVPDDVTRYTMTSSRLEPVPDDATRFSAQDVISQRDTSSPEHLGIPSSPASIPTRSHYAYPVPGDTSDDSMGAVTIPRKLYRKRNNANYDSHNKTSYCNAYYNNKNNNNNNNNNNFNNIRNNNNNSSNEKEYFVI